MRKPGAPASPGFLQLAGHPLRWRLLSELSKSDRQVRELVSAVDQPQSLVSYHLARLRSQQLVSTRRSSADGRDAFYSINLLRCEELLVSTGAALHPGLRLVAGLPATRERSSAAPARVLFLCTGNGARSQMAEALLQHQMHGGVEAFSAGSHPSRLHPNAVRAMRVRGIDIEGRRAKHLSEFTNERFDFVITLCDRVREICPEFDGAREPIHWSVADPSAEVGTNRATYQAFQQTAAELATRIRFLVPLIEARSPR